MSDKSIQEEFINQCFNNNYIDKLSLNNYLYGNQRVNHSFICSYLECLNTYFKNNIKNFTFESFIDNFIPNFKASVEDLTTPHILFSLYSLTKHMSNHFNYLNEEQKKSLVNALVKTNENVRLTIEYRDAIAVFYPSYYKIKKNIKTPL